MEKPKHPFGQTPESVISTQLAAVLATGEDEPFEIADAIANAGGYADSEAESLRRGNVRDFLATFIGFDEMNTLLNALVSGEAYLLDKGDEIYRYDREKAEVTYQLAADYRDLRCAMLAALGIIEED